MPTRLTHAFFKLRTVTANLDKADATIDPRDHALDLLAVCREMAIETAITLTVTSVAMNHDGRQLYNMDAIVHFLLALALLRPQDEASVAPAVQLMKVWRRFL